MPRLSVHARQHLREFGDVTTLHGIRYVTDKRSHILERVCWILTIAACVGFCSYEIYKLRAKWNASPIITSQASQSVHVASIPFPAVTICPTNYISRSTLNVTDKADFERLLKEKLNSSSEDDKLTGMAFVIICSTIDYQIAKDYEDLKLDLQKVRTKIFEVATQIEDIFARCDFSDSRVWCSKIFRPVLTYNGVCFTFNGLSDEDMFTDRYDFENAIIFNESIQTRSSWSLQDGYDETRLANETYPLREKENYLGNFNGLTIKLKLRESDIQTACVDGKNNNRNFKVMIHSPVDNILLKDIDQTHIYMSPGTETLIKIKPEIHEADDSLKDSRYSSVLRGCTFSNEIDHFLFKNMTEENCKINNLMAATAKRCNCTYFKYHLPTLGENDRPLQSCGYETETNDSIPCPVGDIFKNFWKCLPNCDEIRYRYQHSHIHYSDADDQVNETSQILRVFFEDKTFFPIRKSELYGMSDFIANCGGILGLFTGFSIISAVEICYFASLRIYFRVRDKRKQAAALKLNAERQMKDATEYDNQKAS